MSPPDDWSPGPEDETDPNLKVGPHEPHTQEDIDRAAIQQNAQRISQLEKDVRELQRRLVEATALIRELQDKLKEKRPPQKRFPPRNPA